MVGDGQAVALRIMLGSVMEGSDSICVDERLQGRTLQMATGVDPTGVLRFAPRPEDAPIIHFNGPLKMSLRGKAVLRRGEEPPMFTAMIGTPGVGPGSFAGVHTECVPEGVHPLAEITWRVNGDNAAPPPSKSYLKDRC